MTGRAHQQRKVEIAETAMAFPHRALLQGAAPRACRGRWRPGFRAAGPASALSSGIGIAQALFHAQDAFAGRQPRQQFRTLRPAWSGNSSAPACSPSAMSFLSLREVSRMEIAVFVGLHVAELATELRPALAGMIQVGNDDVGRRSGRWPWPHPSCSRPRPHDSARINCTASVPIRL